MRRETFCPSCGGPRVVVGLDSILLDTSPVVRRHVCNVGGPGSSSGPEVSS